MDKPPVKSGKWIEVGGNQCVVTDVYEEGPSLGTGMAVFNPREPTIHDFGWNGEQWVFSERPDFGGYAIENDPYLRQLM
jgi:hypothetical protein